MKLDSLIRVVLEMGFFSTTEKPDRYLDCMQKKALAGEDDVE